MQPSCFNLTRIKQKDFVYFRLLEIFRYCCFISLLFFFYFWDFPTCTLNVTKDVHYKLFIIHVNSFLQIINTLCKL